MSRIASDSGHHAFNVQPSYRRHGRRPSRLGVLRVSCTELMTFPSHRDDIFPIQYYYSCLPSFHLEPISSARGSLSACDLNPRRIETPDSFAQVVDEDGLGPVAVFLLAATLCVEIVYITSMIKQSLYQKGKAQLPHVVASSSIATGPKVLILIADLLKGEPVSYLPCDPVRRKRSRRTMTFLTIQYTGLTFSSSGAHCEGLVERLLIFAPTGLKTRSFE